MAWRKITNAPRNGSPMLLSGLNADGQKIVVLGSYIKTNKARWIYYDWENEGWDAFPNNKPPTHWQPLPLAAR